DTPSRLEEVRKLIARIDVAVRQVMIEARIVEANEVFNKNLGARLGLFDASTNRQMFNGGVRGPVIGAEIGNTLQGAGLATGTANISGAGATNSNLPAAGLNSFTAGVFSFVLFNNALTRFLNVEISALEADGKGKTISSPRVLTADQVEAVIEQGTEIPYQQATSSGATSVSFRKANLSLK